MLYDNVNDYWEAKRKRDAESAPEDRRYKAYLDYIAALKATKGPAEFCRMSASGELLSALSAAKLI